MSVREAPISRGLVDELLPWLRAALGLVFVAYSANSTIFIGARDLLWLFEPTQQITIGAWPDAFWYSSFAALILFAGEVATSERYKRTYWLFLVPDAVYTGRGMWPGLRKAVTILVGAIVGDGPVADALGVIIGLILAAVFGYFVARWGEALLFGHRRQIRGAVIRKER